MPARIYKDPFRGGDNIIVLADTYEPPRVQADGTLSELKVCGTWRLCLDLHAPHGFPRCSRSCERLMLHAVADGFEPAIQKGATWRAVTSLLS